jgi:ribulose-phosphate 3-epimerase
MVKIAPSILAADLSKLAEAVKQVEEGGADFLHFDIMDGRFVPNISFGPIVVKSIREKIKIPFEVHLMVEEPYLFVRPFIQAGADMITVHVECFHRLYTTLRTIRSLGKKVGLALNPPTPLLSLEYLLKNLDMLLIMTVDPGLGGQRFIRDLLPKIEKAREIIDKSGLNIDLAVDGGVNIETAPSIVRKGANILVAGSAIFGLEDPKEGVEALRRSVI